MVKIWLDLPDNAVGQLTEEGRDLSRTALEALAIDAYRTNRITAHQLCTLLEIPSRCELDGFLNTAFRSSTRLTTSSARELRARDCGRSDKQSARPRITATVVPSDRRR
jgi:hypothetical protein